MRHGHFISALPVFYCVCSVLPTAEMRYVPAQKECLELNICIICANKIIFLHFNIYMDHQGDCGCRQSISLSNSAWDKCECIEFVCAL
jgi:hypothetical protein